MAHAPHMLLQGLTQLVHPLVSDLLAHDQRDLTEGPLPIDLFCWSRIQINQCRVRTLALPCLSGSFGGMRLVLAGENDAGRRPLCASFLTGGEDIQGGDVGLLTKLLKPAGKILEMVTSVDIAILAQFMQIFDMQGGICYFPLYAAGHNIETSNSVTLT